MEIQEVVTVGAGNMLSVFAGANSLHPYRLQPAIRLIVPYVEYLKFVHMVTELQYDTLTMPLRDYRENLESKASKLHRFYLCDIADAVLHEVSVSVSYQLPCTQIVHEFPGEGVEEMELEQIASCINSLPTDLVKKAYGWCCKRMGFYVGSNMLPGTSVMWWFAVYLRAKAEAVPFGRFNVKEVV